MSKLFLTLVTILITTLSSFAQETESVYKEIFRLKTIKIMI